ncbi:DUF6186 family protein [Blastococcus sp. SYSU D00813]
MTGTLLSAAAVVMLLVTGAVLETTARRRGHPVTAGRALQAAMRTAPGRATVLLAWAWLGVHFLAR